MTTINSRAEMVAFVRSVELGGFSAAARELGVTPSALSKFVKRLEGRLGVRLLHRTTRNLAPTPEGSQLLGRLRRILDELETAESEVAGTADAPRGRLPMQVGVGFGKRQLLPILPRFLERYPLVQLDLHIEDRMVDLVREGIDIAVSMLPLRDPSLGVRKLCDVERIICASPGYLARHGVPRSPEDLQNHNCITLLGVSSVVRWSFAGGKKVIAVRGDIAVNNAEAIFELGLMGKGIIRINEMVAGEAIRKGRLVPVLAGSYDREKTPLNAIYPERRDQVPRVAAMLAFLQENFRHPPWRARSS